ncbi:MAG: hypothetical protein ACRC7G_01490 [Beijerinckiaceae bacterium]
MASWPGLMVLQITFGALCAATAFGLVLALHLLRGRLGFAADPRVDVVVSDRAYLAGSLLASVGAIMSLAGSFGVFIGFICVAVSFLIAEQFLIPKMRAAAEADAPLPMTATRSRFELLQAGLLLLLFTQISVPPLMTLARVYGL